jgi:hypothetical protein
MSDFTKKEMAYLRKLHTPALVQDFLNTIPFNFEEDGRDTVKSPLRTLREWNAHCMEGALLGAYALSLHGYKPMLLHLKSTQNDFDHIITPFKKNGLWGALSKTNHAVLRYREPIYKTIRELALSYFHEYFTDDGTKTLRQYSKVLQLDEFEKGWESEQDDLWGIDEALDGVRHYDIVPPSHLCELRRADIIEREAGKIVEWKKKRRTRAVI